MTPEDIELERLVEAEGDIRWRLDRGWRIQRLTVDAGVDHWWFVPPEFHIAAPPMQLTPTESHVWETMRKAEK